MWVSSVTLSWPDAGLQWQRTNGAPSLRRPRGYTGVARIANDPGWPRRGNPTALISLGIPKLVRFAKMAPQQFYMVLIWYYYGTIIPYSASRCVITFQAGWGRIMERAGLEAGLSWVSPPLLKTTPRQAGEEGLGQGSLSRDEEQPQNPPLSWREWRPW
jgi:hypothetical protein